MQELLRHGDGIISTRVGEITDRAFAVTQLAVAPKAWGWSSRGTRLILYRSSTMSLLGAEQQVSRLPSPGSSTGSGE